MKEKELLSTLYLEWVDAIIAYTEIRSREGMEKWNTPTVLLVEEETTRIQNLPGCREWIEWVQIEAVHRLDAYDRRAKKQDPFLYFTPKKSLWRR